MKVFISWSGATSRDIAEALAAWFPKVLQGIVPFVSAKDIDKGSTWTVELKRELEDSDFGVVCLAPDNLLSPWLNYEAGAISRSVTSRVCPVLFGVKKEEVHPPIAQLQMTELELDDMYLLMVSMNKAMGEALSSEALSEAVRVWWPSLETAVREIAVPESQTALEGIQEPAQPEASVPEMLSEILSRMRRLDSRMSRVERSTRPGPPIKRGIPDGQRVTSAVLDATLRSGLPVQSVETSSEGVQVVVGADLPQILPGMLATELPQIAREFELGINLYGQNRVATFDRFGGTDEPPF